MPDHSARADELKGIIRRIREARDGRDAGALSGALNDLNDFIDHSEFDDLRKVAQDAQKAQERNLDAGLARQAELAGALLEAGRIFKRAGTLAQAGTKELWIPRVAAVASQALGMFEEFKASVDGIRGQIAKVQGGGDVLTSLDAVLAELDKLRQRAESFPV